MDTLERGRQARLILDSPTYQDATQRLTQDLRSLRLSLPPGDQERAYRLVLMEQAVEKAKRYLEAYLYDAEQAKKQLDKDEQPGPIGRMNARFQRLTR